MAIWVEIDLFILFIRSVEGSIPQLRIDRVGDAKFFQTLFGRAQALLGGWLIPKIVSLLDHVLLEKIERWVPGSASRLFLVFAQNSLVQVELIGEDFEVVGGGLMGKFGERRKVEGLQGVGAL